LGKNCNDLAAKVTDMDMQVKLAAVGLDGIQPVDSRNLGKVEANIGTGIWGRSVSRSLPSWCFFLAKS